MNSIRRYTAYLKYLILHKYYVYKGCRIMKVPFLIALFHDWTKLLPDELIPYARTFYLENGNKQYKQTNEFLYAWNLHQKRNRHHYQHWVILMDNGEYIPLEMPDLWVREMLADWYGAGMAINGRNEVIDWYFKHKDRIKLHPATRIKVEIYLYSYL